MKAIPLNSVLNRCLYRGWVKHDANRRAERSCGEGVGELGADDSRVAMRSGDLAPDHPDVGASLLLLCAVDIGDLLAKVEAAQNVSNHITVSKRLSDILGSTGVIDTLDLDQARLRVGRVTATLVAQVATPRVTWSASCS